MSSKKSKSNSSVSPKGVKPVKQSVAVSSFNEVHIPRPMPKLDNINDVDVIIEKLNEYYDAKNQYEINSIILKNFANFLAIYYQSFISERDESFTQFSGKGFFENSAYNNPKLVNALGIDVDNLETSPKAWEQLHSKCITLSVAYLEKYATLEQNILRLQAKLKELTTPVEDTRQTMLGGRRKCSLKKKRT